MSMQDRFSAESDDHVDAPVTDERAEGAADGRVEDASGDDESVGDEEGGLEVQTLVIRKKRSGRRLDKYLQGRFPRMSRTLIQKLIKQGEITVNGKKAKNSYEPALGDEVAVRVPPPEPTDITPEDIPLTIVYEDDHMLALNKQVDIICHPSKPSGLGTLANGLAHYAGQNLSKGSEAFRPGIVHRLDKNTSGVMLIAKTDEAHWRLGLQFEKREVQKTYFGICEGEVSLDRDIINQPLADHPMIKERYMVPGFPTRQMLFKDAVTKYEVQERFRGFTIVHMYPKTGRTHQLRVHMSAIGYPLVGDTFYGGHFVSEKDLSGSGSEETLLAFQALHAFRIQFRHPITEEPMELSAPIPERLTRIVDLLRAHRAIQ